MPHYGVLHNYKFEDGQDVRGAEVYGVNNEKLGTVSDVIFDHATGEIRYVVIDTGSWLKSRKFLVPINRIQPYGAYEDKFYAELDKERIQMLPEFNDETMKSQDVWEDYERRYHERWNEGVVMYNKDTGRIVTPPADQVTGGRTRPLGEEEKRSLVRDFTPTKMGKEDDLLGVASSGDDVTLRPKKPSVAGRGDVARRQQSSSDKSIPSADINKSGLEEPGVYVVDRVPEAEDNIEQPPNTNYGRRWIEFQQRLREGRDKVVSDCPLCGTQEKVA